MNIERSSCRCGVNKGTTGMACALGGPGYRTQCKCYGTSRACTSVYQCKGCGNLHGTKPIEAKRKQVIRVKKTGGVAAPVLQLLGCVS